MKNKISKIIILFFAVCFWVSIGWIFLEYFYFSGVYSWWPWLTLMLSAILFMRGTERMGEKSAPRIRKSNFQKKLEEMQELKKKRNDKF
jgi:hypothetical protein